MKFRFIRSSLIWSHLPLRFNFLPFVICLTTLATVIFCWGQTCSHLWACTLWLVCSYLWLSLVWILLIYPFLPSWLYSVIQLLLWCFTIRSFYFLYHSYYNLPPPQPVLTIPLIVIVRQDWLLKKTHRTQNKSVVDQPMVYCWKRMQYSNCIEVRLYITTRCCLTSSGPEEAAW